MAGWENTGRSVDEPHGERERERQREGTRRGIRGGKKEQGAWKESSRRELIARWIGWDGRMGDGDGNGWRRSSFF